MTPPMLTAVPPTIHRRRTPAAPGSQHHDLARQIAAQLAQHQPVIVAVDGHGRGWYVTAVGDGVYTVHRDGTTMTVTWTAVSL